MIDWRLILYRLRLGSEYHWLGGDTYAAIGEWRDSETTKPTEQECLDEWDVYVVERDEAEFVESIRATRKDAAEIGMSNIPVWATKSPQEAEQYILDNVIDLNSARLALSKMALMLFYLKDATYPQLRDQDKTRVLLDLKQYS